MNIPMLSPTSLEELSSCLTRMTKESKVIAGGTDLVIDLKQHKILPDLLLNIIDIPQLKEITLRDDAVEIGSAATFSELEKNPLIKRFFPAMVLASSKVGSKQIRNRGTIGGNIIRASAAGDMLPVLLALDARFSVRNSLGEIRIIPVNEFVFQKNRLSENEALIKIILGVPQAGRYNCFVKLGSREAVSISKLNMCLSAAFGGKNRMITESAVTLGSLAPKPIYARRGMKTLDGQILNDSLKADFAEALAKDVAEAIPTRASMPYKRRAIQGLAWDLLDIFAGLTKSL